MVRKSLLIEYMDGGDGDVADHINNIQGLPETAVGTSFLKAVQKRIDEEQNKVDNYPKRDEENIRNDLYFRLGMIAMGKWTTGLPAEAADIMKKQK